MVLRFASQKLLNLYFKCLILHLIIYIKRNKKSLKKKRSVSFCENGKGGEQHFESVVCQLCGCDKCFHLRYAYIKSSPPLSCFDISHTKLSYSEYQPWQYWTSDYLGKVIAKFPLLTNYQCCFAFCCFDN